MRAFTLPAVRLRRVALPGLTSNLVILPSGAVACLEIYTPTSHGWERQEIPIAQWADYEQAGALIPHLAHVPRHIASARARMSNAPSGASQERKA